MSDNSDNTGGKSMQFNRTTTPQRPYTIRYENHQGRRHIVIPVIMMVEGVHCGSHGPVLHTSDELSRYPEAWNGVPVVIDHPSREASPTGSANLPSIVENEVIGRVYNAYFDDKLRGEAWIDEAKLLQRDSGLVSHLVEGLPMDVSVGAFTDDSPADGQWRGEVYHAISHNYRPDHLALLPRAQGACSWQDGCGVRTNERNIYDGGDSMDKRLWTGMLSAGYLLSPLPSGTMVLQSNEVGYREIVLTIQRKLDSMDNSINIHFLEEVYDDNTFIYRVESREGQGSTSLFRRSYQINTETDQVEFEGDPIPVVRRVEYVAQGTQSNKKTFTRTKESTMGTQENKNCGCSDKIDQLLTMGFTEADKSWLQGVDNAGLDRLISLHMSAETPTEEPAEEDVQTDAEPEEAVEEDVEEPTADLSVNSDPLSTLPDDLRKKVDHGLKLYEERRKKVVNHILSNTSVYSADELNTLDTEALEKLARAVKPITDYSVAGAPAQSNSAQSEVLLPPGVKAKE